MPDRSDAELVRAALVATGYDQATAGASQQAFARDVLGVDPRSLRGWLADEPVWEPVRRLAWLIARYPALAGELATTYPALTVALPADRA